MNKVITIHLRGRAYQLEEPGYNKLQQYLAEAGSRLDKDPDKEEIISDLEQSIGEKFERFLTPSKTVVVEKEVEDVLKEMGPVQATDEESAKDHGQAAPKTATVAKRLYKIREGSMIRGVCMGLAAYFNIDVTLVRLAFVVLVLLTHGFMIVAYIIMAIVLPTANTSAEQAAAFGQPFTAQDLVNRTKEEYSRFTDRGERQKWKNEFRKWRYEMREKRRQERQQQRAVYYSGAHRPWIALPFLGIITLVLTIIWIAGLVSLISHGTLYGFMIPTTLPLWIAVLIWLCVYSFIAWPIKTLKHTLFYDSRPDGQFYHYHRHNGFLDTIAWLAFMVVLVWFAWHYIPAVHPYLEKALEWWNHFIVSIRNT